MSSTMLITYPSMSIELATQFTYQIGRVFMIITRDECISCIRHCHRPVENLANWARLESTMKSVESFMNGGCHFSSPTLSLSNILRGRRRLDV